MFDENGTYNADLSEYLRHAKVLAALDPEMPHAIADTVSPEHSGFRQATEQEKTQQDLLNKSMGPQDNEASPYLKMRGEGIDNVGVRPDYVQPPNPNEYHYDPNNPGKINQPMQGVLSQIQQQPMHSDYHPSKMRSILGKIAGVGYGALVMNPQAGVNIAQQVEDAPYNRDMRDYQERLGQASNLANASISLPGEAIKQIAKPAAEIGHYNAESYKSLMPEMYRVKLTNGSEVNARLNPNGSYSNNDTGEILHNDVIAPGGVTKIGTPQRETPDNSPLATYIKAQKLLDDPNTSPEVKKGAQKTKDNFLNKSALNLDAETRLWAEKTKAAYENDATSVPEYEYKAAIDTLKGTKTSEPVEQVMENGHRIYRPRSESVGKEAPTPTPPIGPTMLVPGEGGYKVVSAKPGATIPANAQTPSGVNTQNTVTSTTRTMQEAAPKVLALADKVAKGVDSQEKQLGPAAGRWSEFMAGKVGAPNPEFTKLRTDVMLLQTLLMRMHVGSRGGEAMMEHFKNLIDVAGQSPENLRAALGEIKDYANTVAHNSGANEETNSPAQNVTHRYDPKTGTVIKVQPNVTGR